jgi:hypothetical protein
MGSGGLYDRQTKIYDYFYVTSVDGIQAIRFGDHSYPGGWWIAEIGSLKIRGTALLHQEDYSSSDAPTTGCARVASSAGGAI